MARILSIGAALQDIYLIDHDDFSPTTIGQESILGKILVGSKIEIDRIAAGVGGGGVDAAVAFARHGHESILFSNIGKDAAGEAVLRLLDKENIDSSYLNCDSRAATGTSVILLDSKSGKKTTLASLGAAKSLENFDVTDYDLIRPDWIYVTTLNGDFKTLERIFVKAVAANIKVMFAPGIKELTEPKKLINLFKYLNILIVNKTEAASLVPGVMLAELLSRLNNYVETVIVTDGPMGGIASNCIETFRFGIYEDVKVKDATGAGDAFGAGFLAHFAAGKSFKSSLIFASANATSVVSKIGANTGTLKGNESLHPMPIQKI
ncbi:MAG: carbohydrate kinase family protein [Candidatus Saccharibacteria bacterium]|nr:carbohydrate kinase family protein [Candidatus Saccharibacteria bacterium]